MRNKSELARRGWNMLETTPNKWNKEKPSSWQANNDIDSHSVVLNSINFYLKQITSPRVFRVFRVARYHGLYRSIFFNRKDGFLLTPNICFHDAQISKNNIFCLNGFTYIMSEAAVPSFRLYSYSEHFWKNQWKSPYFNDECLQKIRQNLTFVFTDQFNALSQIFEGIVNLPM